MNQRQAESRIEPGRRIDVHGGELRHAQVLRRLEADILTGNLAPGERLASERELGARLGVARNTLRRALAMLESRGLIQSHGRRGWVVTAAFTERVDGPQGLTDWAGRLGLVVTSRLRTSRVRPASEIEAARLRVPAGAGVFELERVRLIDGVPLSHDRSVLHPRLSDLLTTVDFSTASLYATLRDRASVVPSRADLVFRAVQGDERTVGLLEVPAGAALLELTETVFDQYGEPFETATLVNRGDRYAFGTSLSVDGGVPRIELDTRA